ncbi:guanosine polyphosphate pyrophosphohydrolase/synthetase [Rickettsia australis str. Cutlack]|uniref:Guanosine polyphosphate pyrophosphohydrolase/synthetase n=1 Tax=Rickettsia australis (strain Cutlack) TaxID=1105110 RepID=H8K735_RICAC|nr:guanosine polyphosphate pyrophosphohydrolase/synthetase [Rickettsia australis str. Cutlack]
MDTLKNCIILATYLELFEVEAKLTQYCLQISAIKSNLQSSQMHQSSYQNSDLQTYSSLTFQNDSPLVRSLYWPKLLQ